MILHELYDLTPTVNFASRSFAQAGTIWGPRTIPDCQFFYVVSGEARLELGSAVYKVLPGECVSYGENSPHRLSTVKPTDYVSLHFCWNESSPVPVHPAHGIRAVDASALSIKAQSYRFIIAGQREMPLPHHLYIPNMESVLMGIVTEYRQEQLAHPLLLRARMMEFITLLFRQLTSADNSIYGVKVENALRAMREHPPKNWSVAELAMLCGYHASYFTKLFREEVGQNPKSYLISERIRQAKQALLSGERLDSIADRLGYMSVHYFSRNFKKETGLTPSEFRQQGTTGISDPQALTE